MKNGPARRDITFKRERIEMDDSGNYSCVFSEEQLEITEVKGYGHNIIFINVIGKMYDTSASCARMRNVQSLVQINHNRLTVAQNCL